MARLEVEIVASGDGVKKAEGLLEGLQKYANSLKIELFKAETRGELNQVGTLLSGVTDKIKAYTNEALKSNDAFKDNQTLDTLIKLETKISQVGNNQKLLSNETAKTNAEIRAFQSAIDALIKNGLDPAGSQVQQLQTKVGGLIDRLKSLSQVPVPDISEKFKSTGNAIVDTENKIKNLQNALRMPNLSTKDIASYNIRIAEARIELSKLNKVGIESTNIESERSRSLKRLSSDLELVRNQASGLGRIAGGGGASSAQSTSAISGELDSLLMRYVSLIAVYNGLSKVININAEISDSFADVRRTAGLTAVEINTLADQLKSLDTRTSLKDLLDISTIGGQLGIAKDQLLGFSQSVDKLSVALSSELQGGAEGVAKSLGILNNVFKVSDSVGGDVGIAFDKIGSAVLKLGQVGLATGQYLSDFGERVGGVAAQSGLSLPRLLAFGAILQEQGVTAEVAGTSFKKLIIDLSTKREKFFAIAQIADSNLTLSNFTDLINNDVSSALKLFLEGLQKGGKTTTEFNDLLKSTGSGAGRISQVVSALALNLDTLETRTNQANSAFKEATLGSERFAIKNDTLAASIDKLQNSISNVVTGPDSGLGKAFKFLVDAATDAINAIAGVRKESDAFYKSYENGLIVAGKISVSSERTAQAYKELGEERKKSLKDDLTGIAVSNADRLFTATNNQTQATKLLSAEQQKLEDIRKRFTYNSAYIKNPENEGSELKARIANQNKLNTELFKQQQLVKKLQENYTDLYGKKVKMSATQEAEDALGIVGKLEAELKQLREDRPGIKVKSELDFNRDEIKRVEAEINKLNGKEVKVKVSVSENYLDKISNIGKKSDFSAESVGLTGQVLDLAKIAEKYKSLNDDILATEKKAINDLKLTEKEKAAIISAGADRRAELRKNQFEENAGIYQKYAQKEVNAAKSVYDKIAEFENGLAKAKDPVIARLEAQIAKYNELYNAIKKPTEADQLKQFQIIGNLQLQIKQRENEPPDKKQQTILDGTIANFNSGLKRGVTSFTKNFIESISNISQYADSTFKGATSSIIGNMIGSFSSISLSFVSELLSEKLKAGIKEGTLDLTTKLSAAASIAGGILSGATNKTSTIGQGLGGALGGAGAGAGIGSSFGPQGALIGAAIGGFVGLLGGIFGAADARRQEREIQKKQLEEAKKQTDLLRAQAQAWTSAIIGQMSNMGVITGVDRDAFGTPQWKIRGRDLVLVHEREEAAKKRGV